MRNLFLASAILVVAVLLAGISSARAGDVQQPKGSWQKPGEIQQPKGTWQVPGDVQKPGEIQKVKEKCAERFRVGSDALFAFDKAELTPASEETLRKLQPMIRSVREHPISIEGHTDSIGDAKYNRRLSEKRAEAVLRWFADHKFLPADTPIKGYGKEKPVAPNTKPDGTDNPAGRALNRRVEIVVDTCR